MKYQKTIEQIAGLALIGAVVVGCGFVLRPFVSAILWAAILCFATWPLYELFLRWFRGRRTLAAGLMTGVLSIVLVIPFVVAGVTFTDSIRSILHTLDPNDKTLAPPSVLIGAPALDLLDPAGEAEVPPVDPNIPATPPPAAEPVDPNALSTAPPPASDPATAPTRPNSNRESILPPPPRWVERIPLVGAWMYDTWTTWSKDAELALKAWTPWLKEAGRWLLRHSLDFAQGLLQLVMSVLIAFFFYRDGEGLVIRLREGFQKISGDTAQRMMDVVKTTVQSVVYGVLGTALAQGIVAGIGFVIAGAPAPMILALLTFFLSFLPFGPPIIWIGASIWLFAMGRTGSGIFMAVYGVCVISIVDNIIKPIIISRGSKLSFIVMFIGVLGGVAAFGFIGIFLGPTLLAVGFSLGQEILEQRRYGSLRTLVPASPGVPPAETPPASPPADAPEAPAAQP
ncbi:MAG: AI-2E family transporter [Planctomycetes bacterium]|nr:AI-2E family transporter [Planctomycetota bacterium]